MKGMIIMAKGALDTVVVQHGVRRAPQLEERLRWNSVSFLIHNLDGKLFEELVRQRICKSAEGLHTWLLVSIHIIHIFPQVNRHLFHILIERIPIAQEVF
jgi:hypothetical protein